MTPGTALRSPSQAAKRHGACSGSLGMTPATALLRLVVVVLLLLATGCAPLTESLKTPPLAAVRSLLVIAILSAAGGRLSPAGRLARTPRRRPAEAEPQGAPHPAAMPMTTSRTRENRPPQEMSLPLTPPIAHARPREARHHHKPASKRGPASQSPYPIASLPQATMTITPLAAQLRTASCRYTTTDCRAKPSCFPPPAWRPH
jgi:hypothetical protein